MRAVLIAAAALAVFATLEALYYGAQWLGDRRNTELRRRLQAVGHGAELDAELLRRGRLARQRWLSSLLSGVPLARRLERLLEQADSSWTVAHLIVFSAVAGGTGAMLGVALKSAPLVVGAFGVLGLVAPLGQVLVSRAQRSTQLSEQLPEALEMMARSLRAGHAMTTAFQVVASEMPQPVSIEFARAYEEQRLGLTLERAVVQMSERSPGNSDLKIFAVSAVIQRETGGNLAEILEKIADTVRQRFRFHGKVRSLTAEGRASAVVLGAMPFVLAVTMSVLSPEYFAVLPGTPSGRAIIAAALVGWAIGLVWLYRMTQLEV
jgi:tight adherence protein B